MHDDVGARRAARANWPIRVTRLGDESADADDTTAEQRLAMMWELVTQAWAVAGMKIPDYDRAHTPVRKVRRGDPEDEDDRDSPRRLSGDRVERSEPKRPPR